MIADKTKNARRWEEVPAGAFGIPRMERGRCGHQVGRRIPSDREALLFRRHARVAGDVGAGNAQVVQFAVGQVGQLVIGLTEAFPVIEFANNSIDHGLGLSLSHGHGTADRRLARSSLTGWKIGVLCSAR